MSSDVVLARLRRFLIGLSGLILAGTLVELLLEEHYQETIQFVPFALCILGAIVAGMAFFRPNRGSLRALRTTMIVIGLGGGIGAMIHFIENFEFEREVHAAADFITQLFNAVKGAAPLFAPGVMTFAALIALAAAYYHPALRSSEAA